MPEETGVIILRDLSRGQHGGATRGGGPVTLDPLSSGLNNGAISPSGRFVSADADPQVTLEVRDPRILTHARQDPTVVAMAETMPLTLISPLDDGELGDSEATANPLDEARNRRVTWGVEAVGADESLFSGKNVSVAVLDTGIDAAHPAFNVPDLQILTENFTSEGPEDRHGHGTHCAGTIFGREVEGVRIGVAPGVRRALIGKVIGGGAGTKELIDAMEWAIGNGAQVISMSLGFDFPGLQKRLEDSFGMPQMAATSRALEAYRDNIRLFDEWMAMNAARDASNSGAVVVAAAGNESRRRSRRPYEIGASSPSAANEVISVGALAEGRNGLNVASFSNTNPDISAPGVSVVSSALGGGLTAMNGTSMACPHVAGLAALYWDQLFSSPLRAKASTVKSRLIGGAQYSRIFDPNIDMVDVGVGLAIAP